MRWVEENMKKVIALLALLNIVAFAQTFVDQRDNKKYKTVKIGNQNWMAQNLDYHGEDGYTGLCYGDKPKIKISNPGNCEKYGRLYDWEESKKVCPTGWHLPNDNEWKTLVNFLGGNKVAGKKLKATSDEWKKCKWEDTDNRGRVIVTDLCGTDEHGFSALPGGFSQAIDGGSQFDPVNNKLSRAITLSFDHINVTGIWWSRSARQFELPGYNIVVYKPHIRRIFSVGSEIQETESNPEDMSSVRCIEDSQKEEEKPVAKKEEPKEEQIKVEEEKPLSAITYDDGKEEMPAVEQEKPAIQQAKVKEEYYYNDNKVENRSGSKIDIKKSTLLSIALGVAGAVLIYNANSQFNKSETYYNEYRSLDRGMDRENYDKAWKRADDARSKGYLPLVLGGVSMVSAVGVYIWF
jgi:uncharacterized protein (TIGR02145 family)